MDKQTAEQLLSRVRELSKQAGADHDIVNVSHESGFPKASPDNLKLALLGLGVGTASTAMYGGGVGALTGLGYGAAKRRPIAGAARGGLRGGLTAGGTVGGAGLGFLAANQMGGSPLAHAAAVLGGGVLGGVAGWKGTDKLVGKKMDEKEAADPTAEAFSGALHEMTAQPLKQDAFADVRNVGLTALGVGAAGRGLIGLVQMLRANRQKKTRSGPTHLPLPYPALASKTAGILDTAQDFGAGNMASSKAGIPWYGPAMMLGGLAGLGAGWHGVDKILNSRREQAIKRNLEDARQEFHDALLSQYAEPIKTHPGLLKKANTDTTMAEVGRALDGLFDSVNMHIAAIEKRGFDLPNAAGVAAGGYGMWAGLSGLLTGAYMYDKMSKRSQRAILEKALQKRQRRKFMQSPPEIYAVPEAVPTTAAVE